MDGSSLGYDGTVTDGTASPAQRVAEDSKEDNRCDDTLEGEEVLHLGAVRLSNTISRDSVPLYREYTERAAAGGNKAESRPFLRW